MRRLKIGIRPQLIMLVGFASLFSLLILGILTGVYFSGNLSQLRAERLEVISQLKTAQVRQAVVYIFYQVYWLSQKDQIFEPLGSYRAGNNSKSIFSEAQTSLDQFILSSEIFAAARLYNLDLQIMAESYYNESIISQPTMDVLFPLSENSTPPAAILGDDFSNTGYFTGPMSNDSSENSSYYLGITLPVYSNSSIILDDPSIAGYLTVLANSQNIQTAITDTTTMGASSSSEYKDYVVLAVKPVYSNDGQASDGSDANTSSIVGFETVFPVYNSALEADTVYNINSSESIRTAFSKSYGSATNVKSYEGTRTAIGYTQIELDPQTYWAIIVEQPRSKFLAPVKKLTKITTGVVIGIGVFMCLVTFPLAVWFVRPITKLQEATENITRLKKQGKPLTTARSDPGDDIRDVSPPPPYGLTHRKQRSATSSKRHSVASTGSTSQYLTGIRLPAKVKNSKKIFKDELTELCDAFNIMTEELDKQYTHLEDRVKLRTKELEASKLEAEAANEAKTVFIANISHELRTPLNGILGMTSIAMDEPDHLRIQDLLKLIHRSGELLLHILTELLTYSKNTLNRSKLEKSNFQIIEIVYQVQSIFGKLATDQKVNFKILLKPNILRKMILYGDSNRIIQIVMNLVSNSLKFTPVDGLVDVTFRLLGEYDFERSHESNFSKVYIRNRGPPVGTSGAAKPEPKHPPVPNYNKPLPVRNPSYYHTKKVPQPPTDIELESLSSPDDDNISVVTLSTTEYENTIFEAQFNHRRERPLPHRPDSIIEELDDNGNPKTPSSSSHDTLTNGDSDKGKPEFAPPSAPHANGMSTPRRTSLASNHSAYATSKDKQLHKTRNLYEPRSWAIEIEVKDTGPGIEPALQEKVFEPFIQGDQTLSRSYGGTGLGLSICRQLARMMHGTLLLKSTIGQGSTFTFVVPLPQTGEVMVPEAQMEAFCEDEFNPKSKTNRRVAFNVDHEVSREEHPDYATDNTMDSTPPRELHFGEASGSSPVPTKPKDSPEIPTLTLTEDKPKFKHKLELPRPLFDKPHLIARSSTGTANSSTGSDKNDPLLEYLLHLRILVAEDNLVNQEVIKRMLKLEGFTNIVMACNGAEAVDFVKESYELLDYFDLIFMDVQMPKIDGLTATRMIRNNLRFDKPIIALTAFADESNVKECLNSGMSGFLAKPIKRTNLRKIITEFSPKLLNDVITTPNTHQSDERRLGFGQIDEDKA